MLQERQYPECHQIVHDVGCLVHMTDVFHKQFAAPGVMQMPTPTSELRCNQPNASAALLHAVHTGTKNMPHPSKCVLDHVAYTRTDCSRHMHTCTTDANVYRMLPDRTHFNPPISCCRGMLFELQSCVLPDVRPLTWSQGYRISSTPGINFLYQNSKHQHP